MNPLAATLCTQLGELLGAGAPLIMALESSIGASQDTRLDDILGKAIATLKAGGTLFEGLEGAQDVFGAQTLAALARAEALGELATAFKRAGNNTLASPAPSAPKASVTDGQAPVWMTVLMRGLDAQASDIHLEAASGGGGVLRFRIDGMLNTQETLDSTAMATLLASIRAAANLPPGQPRVPQSGRIELEVGQDPDTRRKLEVRVSVIPTMRGESAVLRIVEPSRILQHLNDLERIFPDPEQRQAIEKAALCSHGVFLATGPTSSGKTTTLYAMLMRSQPDKLKIVAVEDHCEVTLPGVTHMATNHRRGMSFGATLRGALRSDPDVVYCSEIRDTETANMLIQIALTGHRVFSQLHSPDAASALMRLRNMGLEPYMLAETIRGIVSQRLVRRLCPHCARPSEAERAKATSAYGADRIDPEATFLEPVGCPKCQHRGYLGRLPVYELLTLSPALYDTLYNASDADTLRRAIAAEPYERLADAALKLIQSGQTTATEVLRTCPPTS